MVSKLGYDSHVKRLNSATVAVLALVLGGVLFLAARCECADQRDPSISDLDQLRRPP